MLNVLLLPVVFQMLQSMLWLTGQVMYHWCYWEFFLLFCCVIFICKIKIWHWLSMKYHMKLLIICKVLYETVDYLWNIIWNCWLSVKYWIKLLIICKVLDKTVYGCSCEQKALDSCYGEELSICSVLEYKRFWTLFFSYHWEYWMVLLQIQ